MWLLVLLLGHLGHLGYLLLAHAAPDPARHRLLRQKVPLALLLALLLALPLAAAPTPRPRIWPQFQLSCACVGLRGQLQRYLGRPTALNSCCLALALAQAFEAEATLLAGGIWRCLTTSLDHWTWSCGACLGQLGDLHEPLRTNRSLLNVCMY